MEQEQNDRTNQALKAWQAGNNDGLRQFFDLEKDELLTRARNLLLKRHIPPDDQEQRRLVGEAYIQLASLAHPARQGKTVRDLLGYATFLMGVARGDSRGQIRGSYKTRQGEEVEVKAVSLDGLYQDMQSWED